MSLAALKKRRNEEERVNLRQAMSRSVNRESIVVHSQKMEDVFRLVERVAPARSTVLVTGESGTGKELVAKAIHEASLRADQPFVVVNCTNIPSELLGIGAFWAHTRRFYRSGFRKKRTV